MARFRFTDPEIALSYSGTIEIDARDEAEAVSECAAILRLRGNVSIACCADEPDVAPPDSGTFIRVPNCPTPACMNLDECSCLEARRDVRRESVVTVGEVS